jgi:hypothetical protein
MRILLVTLLCLSALQAQQALSEPQLRTLDAMERDRKTLWSAKDYAGAAKLLEQVLADPELKRFTDPYVNGVYNLACAYALSGQTARAVSRLRDLMQFEFHDVTVIEKDTDFDSIRKDPGYLAVLAEMKSIPDFWNGPAWKTSYQPDLSEDQKIAGLSRFWSEVKFNFAWFEHLPHTFDWDALYLAYIPKVRATHSTLEYYRVLQELCAQLKDAHTNVNLPNELGRECYAAPAVRTRLVEGHVLLSEVWAPASKDGITTGLEIIAIDGIPVQQYGKERVAPYQSSSTVQDLNVRTFEYSLLLGKDGYYGGTHPARSRWRHGKTVADAALWT